MDLLILLLLSLSLAIVGFVFEAYPRFINRYCGVDIWTHLLYLQEYHKQKGIPKKIENGFLVTGTYDYPPAFIFILSKFPIKYVKQYEFLFSPFFDSIFSIMIFSFSYYFTQNILIAFLTQFIYFLTPIIVLENSSATPRSIGYTLFTLVFLSIFIFESTNNYWLILFAIVLGSFIFLAHRFTTQSFLFFSLFFSVITFNFLYMSIFILAFLLSLVISKGFYLKVLKGHLGNLKFWKDNIAYRFAHQVKGTMKQHKTNDFVFRMYNEFLRFPPFVLAITNPWVISALCFYYFFPQSDPLIIRMAQVVIFSYILSLITIWVPSFRFLGEGQRYLELSAFPTAFLSAKLLYGLFTNWFIVCSFILVGICSFITIIVIQRKAIIKDQLRTLTPSLKEMFGYLKSLKKKPKLLCVPHQMTTSTIYHTGCPVFVNADYANIEKIADIYPYIRKPIKNVMLEKGLDMVLLNEKYATIEELGLKKYKIIKKFENYLLINPL